MDLKQLPRAGPWRQLCPTKRVTCQIEPLVSSPSAILFPFKACPGGGSGCVLLGPDSCVIGQTVSQADQACREYAFQRPSLSPGQNFLEALELGSLGFFFFFLSSVLASSVIFGYYYMIPQIVSLPASSLDSSSRLLENQRNRSRKSFFSTWEMALTWCG